MKKPNFFILGAPKCGTTALAHYLAEHPSVFMTHPKEPHHFNTDHNYGAFKDRDHYLTLFEPAGKEHVAVGEASVWYLYSEVAVANILRELPEARFIVILRNPVEMAPSLHEQMVFSGYETELNFEKAWALQSVRFNGRNIPVWCNEPKFLQYREACSLGKQFTRASRLIPHENLFTVVFDDFRESPDQVWAQLLHFLNVPEDGRTVFPVINSAKVRRSLIAKRIEDAYRSLRNAVGFKGLGTGVFSAVNRWNIVQERREKLQADTLVRLQREFHEDVDILESVLKRDLTAWKQ